MSEVASRRVARGEEEHWSTISSALSSLSSSQELLLTPGEGEAIPLPLPLLLLASPLLRSLLAEHPPTAPLPSLLLPSCSSFGLMALRGLLESGSTSLARGLGLGSSSILLCHVTQAAEALGITLGHIALAGAGKEEEDGRQEEEEEEKEGKTGEDILVDVSSDEEEEEEEDEDARPSSPQPSPPVSPQIVQQEPDLEAAEEAFATNDHEVSDSEVFEENEASSSNDMGEFEDVEDDDEEAEEEDEDETMVDSVSLLADDESAEEEEETAEESAGYEEAMEAENGQEEDNVDEGEEEEDEEDDDENDEKEDLSENEENNVDNSTKTEKNQFAQIQEEEEDGEDEKEDLSEDEEDYIDNGTETEANQLVQEEEEDGEDEKEEDKDLSGNAEKYDGDNSTETEGNHLMQVQKKLDADNEAEEETLNEDDDCVPSFRDDPEKYAEEYDEENAGFGYQTMEIEPIEITKPASVANIKVETPSTQSDGFPCPLCTLSLAAPTKLKEHLSSKHLTDDIKANYMKDERHCCVDDCGKEFPMMCNLIRHIGSTHGKVVDILRERGVEVPECLLESRRESLGKKRRTRESEGQEKKKKIKVEKVDKKKFSCDVCSRDFARIIDMFKHKEKNHN